MLATYNEIDLAGELQSECCEHDIDQTECDCFCHEPEACAEHPAGCPSAIIIPFPTPGGW